MTNFSYENQGTNTYLVYSVGENETIDQMGLGMLTNNKILGLAETLYTQMNSERYIKYNVTAKIPARGYLDGIVSKKRLLGVFKGIVSAILNAEDYMIPMEMMVLDLDYIFVDVSNSEATIICLPVPRTDSRDLKLFLKEIVLSAQYNPQENCDYVAKLMNVLNSPASLSLVAFKELLDELSKEKEGANLSGSKPISVAPMGANSPAQFKIPNVSPEIQIPMPNIPTPNQVPMTPASAPVQNEVPIENNIIQEQSAANSSVEEISLGYLLAHYSKENAAKYKAYKDAQKANASPNPKPVKAAPVKQATPKAPAPQAGFAIPGQNAQQNPNGFAIPGQPIIAPNGQAYTYPSKHAPQAKAATPTPAAKASKQAPVQPIQIPGEHYAAPVQQPVQQPVQPVVQQRKSSAKQESSLDFGETVMLGMGSDDNATVMLTNVSSFSPYFLRVSTGEKVRISKPLFHLGREQSYVDYVINNSAVGRSHADVVLADEKVFVIDMNSTNHTYVNGAMIASGVQIPLEHGDKLKLANEEFEVHYY